VAGYMNLVAWHGVFNHDLGLLGGCKLNCAHGYASHSVSKVDVLEALVLSDVVVVRDVDTEWAAVGSEGDDF